MSHPISICLTGENPSYHRFTQIPSTPHVPLSVAIIGAIASIEDVDPSELDFILSTYINRDILEALASDGRGEWEFDFVVDTHLVTVGSDGHIIVDGHTYRRG